MVQPDDLAPQGEHAPGAPREPGFAAPRTPLEASLCAIWAEVLEVERVGIRDDFLELGGSSVQAMRVLLRVLDDLDAEVALPSLFRLGTVEELARHLDETRWAREALGGSGDAEADDREEGSL
ncbi:MAG TPA: phosphopantetheine-binding protein [Longimicrobiaceae bacterium]|jgi:acyl carrier protein